MTARATLSSITLMVAATAIAACGTTAPTPSAGFAAEERPKSERRVVRAPIVDDDPVLEASVAPRKKAAAPRSKKPVTADAASVSETTVSEATVPAAEPPKPVPEPKKHAESDPAPAVKKDETAALPVGGAGGGTSSGGPGGGQTIGADAPSAPPPADAATTASPPTPSDTLGTAIETPPTVSVEATSPEGGTAPARPGFPWTFSELRDTVNQPVAGFPLWMFIVGGLTLLVGLLLATRRRRKPVREEPVVREERRYDDDGEPQPA